MAKDKIAYVCSNCGYDSPKWIGKCPNCGKWNTFKEIRVAPVAAQTSRSVSPLSNANGNRRQPRLLRDISAEDLPRFDMLDTELNRVLGGGLVPGSIVLLGGEPGIGKSTLVLQTLIKLPQNVLYVSGEESEQQIKMRATRIAGDNIADNISVLSETSL